MEIGNIANVAAITVICYLLAMGVKATKLDNKYIPVICGVMGGILGIAGMFIIPEYPAGDVLNAAAVGIVSGLAATGVNQVYKQLRGNMEKDIQGIEMQQYRKKSVTVSAYVTETEQVIHTLEGDMIASPGDYIVTGVNGEKYPCKPDIFHETYEAAEDVKRNDM